METRYKSIFSRNLGLFTESEQEKLRQSIVAIAGVGGVGGLLAERLIRLGVGRIKITDPGTFEESNLNRQFSSSIVNLGKNKAEEVFKHIKDINPQASIFFSKDGIRTENEATLFVSDCEVIIDEMDFGLLRESILLQREARRQGIYYLFTAAMGFGALAAIFEPNGMTIEEYNKLPLDVDLDDTEALRVPLEIVAPVMPSYTSMIDADTVQKFIAGEMPGPTTSIGVGLASILAANEAMNIILKKREIVIAPQYTYIDLLDRKLVIGVMK